MMLHSRRYLPLLLVSFLFYACSVSPPIRYHVEHHYAVNDPQFARSMGSLLGPPLISGNTTTTLRNGDEIFPAMLDAIYSAQNTITFETHIYWAGDVGRQFANALAERARSGIKVHVILDWLGALQIDRAYIRQMKEAGAEVYEYHPFSPLNPFTLTQINNRTHRKLLIIDGRVGFTGGVGIADEWAGHGQDKDHWRENHYRVEGPAVAQLQAVFVDNWTQLTGNVLDGPNYFPPLAAAGDQFAQVFSSSYTGGAQNMQLLMLLSFAAAEKTIRMETPYFVPDDLTQEALVAAVKRGVRVEIIVPGRHIDVPVVRSASRARWGKLLEAGVHIYEYKPTMIHCKLLIVDGLWTSIGSANLDNRSFRLNDEANINILNAPFALQQTRIFQQDKEKTEEVHYAQWQKRPLLEQLSDDFTTIAGEQF